MSRKQIGSHILELMHSANKQPWKPSRWAERKKKPSLDTNLKCLAISFHFSPSTICQRNPSDHCAQLFHRLLKNHRALYIEDFPCPRCYSICTFHLAWTNLILWPMQHWKSLSTKSWGQIDTSSLMRISATSRRNVEQRKRNDKGFVFSLLDINYTCEFQTVSKIKSEESHLEYLWTMEDAVKKRNS